MGLESFSAKILEIKILESQKLVLFRSDPIAAQEIATLKKGNARARTFGSVESPVPAIAASHLPAIAGLLPVRCDFPFAGSR